MTTSPDESMKKIELLGNFLDHREQRLRLLKVGLQVDTDKPSENVLLTGCHPLTSLTPVKSVSDVLTHYGVSFTFLSREHCCGHQPLKQYFNEDRQDPSRIRIYDDFARKSECQNILKAKELGARSIVTICAGCNTMWNRLSKNQGLEIRHYLDLILDVFEHARLEREIDFYEGCHRLHNFVPEFQKSILENSKKVLTRIEGLALYELPAKLCCRIAPEKVMSLSRTGTIVTPSACCYSFLTRSRTADSPKIKFLGELLSESLGIGV